MEISNFIEKFAEIFDDTDATFLTPDTQFRDLEEWSSLSVLGVIALADEEFDVELSGKELKSVTTIQDLFDLLNNK